MTVLITIAEWLAVFAAAFGAWVLSWLAVLFVFGGEFYITVRPRRLPQVTRIGRLACPRCGAPTVVPDDARDLTEGDAR